MSIYQAVDALSRQGITPFLRFEGQRLEKLLRKGERFEQIISGRSYYEDDFAYVIHHGQLNGMLGESLYQYSEVLLNKMTEKAEDFLAVCQPAMLVVIGGLVLCLFASIMLPIFHIVNGL
ncbi:type II secretion system F family protein [Terrilactibacillus sp. S3-3]|nr:type II secretion system F family protein [Terrilactibacillus sp. S3-3]